MLKEKADIRSGENLSIHGSTIQGKDVDLEAGKDIQMTAAENRSEMDIHEKTKNGGISTSWGIGGLSGVKVYGQSAKGMENAASLTHTASEVSAENTLHVFGGNDTIMTGSRMEGGKVVLATGGSLRIESLQDTESYKRRSNVKGGALASDVFKDSAGHKSWTNPTSLRKLPEAIRILTIHLSRNRLESMQAGKVMIFPSKTIPTSKAPS